MGHVADDFLQRQLGEAGRRLDISAVLSGQLPFEEWKAAGQEKLSTLLGGAAQACPSNFAVKQSVALEDGLVLELASYDSEPGLPTPALVLRRNDSGGHNPGVLLLHGHGEDMYDVMGINEALQPTGSTNYSEMAFALARAGAVVFAPELLGFGSLRREKETGAAKGQSSCHWLTLKLSMLGRSLLGVRVHQARRALTCLGTRCDGQRMGVAGFSGGGTVAAFASALDRRAKAVAVLGYGNLFAHSVMDEDHCACNYVHGLMQWFDIPDILAMCLPNHLFMGFGKQDTTYPLAGALAAAELLRQAATAAGGTLQTDEFDGGHQVNGLPVAQFLLKNV